MLLIIEFSIITNKLSKDVLQTELSRFKIKELLKLEEWCDGSVICEFTIDYNKHSLEQLRRFMHSKDIIMGERYCPVYSNEEYEHAPLFQLHSIGRDPYPSKRTKYIKETLCVQCGCFKYHLEGTLGMNTSQLKNKILINVDYRHWVLSESGAELFEKWGIRGYKVTPVKHIGSTETEIPGYLMSDIHLLPKASKDTIEISIDGKGCNKCRINEYWSLPLYESTITNNMKDINLGVEYDGFGSYGAIPRLFLSNCLRRLLLENGFTEEVRNPYIPGKQNLQINGWNMSPLQLK